jgi:hypothetical protein
MAEGTPVVAFLTTAYQSLCFLEYVKENKISGGVVYQTDRPVPSARARVHSVLTHATGFHVRTRQAKGFWSYSPEPQVFAVAEEIAAELGEPAPGLRLLTGDYRDPVPWILAHRWGLGPDAVVVLDDGMWNASLRRNPGAEVSPRWHDHYTHPEVQPIEAATFFTSFGDQAVFAAGDRVIRNEWGWLRSRYQAIDEVGNVVVIVGNPFSQFRIMSREDERIVTAGLLAAARRLYPGGNVLYAAHEREDDAKLQEIATECDVVRFDVPLELLAVETGILPRAVVGSLSTALISLADLAGGSLNLHAQRIDLSVCAPHTHEGISNIYRTIEESYVGTIDLID